MTQALVLFLFALPLIAAQIAAEKIASAQTAYAAGDLASAEKLLAEVLADTASTPRERALAHSDTGVICHDLGRPAEAERHYRKAIEMMRAERADTLWLRATTNLASMYLEIDEAGKAERLLRSVDPATLPAGDDEKTFRGIMGSLHMVRGRSREAEEAFVDVAAWWTQRNKPRYAATAYNNLGVLARNRNDHRTAVEHFRKALDAWDQFRNDQPCRITILTNLGAALVASGDKTTGVDYLREALEAARRWHGNDGRVTAEVAAHYAGALKSVGRKNEAKAVRAAVPGSASAFTRHTVDVLDLAGAGRGKR